MKNIILFSILFSINIFSQKKITIASKMKTPITDALLIIDNTPRYISDSLGNVEIKFEDLKSSISIRHLNFEPKTFENWINQDTLFLEEKLEELENIEIIASNKTKKKTEKLFPKSSARNILPENFGKSGSLNNNIELVLFFPNENYKGKVIKKVYVHTNDYKVIEDLKNKKSTKRKGAKNSPIKVNFYSVDSIYFVPKEKIFKEDFIIASQNNEKFAILELTFDEEFEFPLNGVFISIKNLSKEEYNNLGIDFPPGIKLIGVSKENKIIPYFRYLHQGDDALWQKYHYLIERNNTYKVGIEFKN
ncbi:hypothetical protein GFJ95_04960 [Flavobacterium sp. LMO9]|uniref:hypothetical protein n=2 Tax=unclassified Flavobacterium TaxID=196869 RepID=UPI0012916DFB|nr:hypothetical protein [Flavobacterium sp. LMO6]MQP52173.1 hypothetical protein [Flavobacterium sp. LMO9]MQP62043.1 hypothetical protein [Flavobacterium sp. LMO6]